MRSGKLKIVVLAVLGGIAFAGAFLVSRHFGTAPAQASAQVPPPSGAAAPVPVSPLFDAATLTEQRALQSLIRDVRAKLRGCEKRETAIGEEERRLTIARQDIEKQAQELEKLRVELATNTSQLKQAHDELQRSRVAIRQEEQTNLKRAAAIYDKMASDAAGRIFESMCKDNREADAVKILHYMTERAVAKVLAAVTDEALAAQLSAQMKRIHVEE
ncbi:MAG TPA: hypothetical protein VM431_05715 [Phycisphaerae bacterium]|nr:hypothetical protein [Phycisphaerae bacterium]